MGMTPSPPLPARARADGQDGCRAQGGAAGACRRAQRGIRSAAHEAEAPGCRCGTGMRGAMYGSAAAEDAKDGKDVEEVRKDRKEEGKENTLDAHSNPHLDVARMP